MPHTSGIRRAAQYVRMSTERQDYSIPHQIAVLAAYALEHGYQIVRTYADAGISGLKLDKRNGLKDLLADVIAGTADFATILVYDVSRWGRFQNPDQAAHYEFMCAEAGVGVNYCTEAFENDGSMTSSLLKSLKRAMAAEFSRELSVRTSRSKRGLSELGYWVAGRPGYGLRRCYLPPHGQPTLLEYGEQKPYRTGRTVLVRGPEKDLRVVRDIYRLFVSDGHGLKSIARQLNRRRVLSEDGGPWTDRRVGRVLRNEAYSGTCVQLKSRMFLGERTELAPEQWSRVKTRFAPVVSKTTFKAAAKIMLDRWRRRTDEEMLEPLRTIFAREGRISYDLVLAQAPYGYMAYCQRFGGLVDAYARAGLPVTGQQARTMVLRANSSNTASMRASNEEIVDRFRAVLAESGRLSLSIIAAVPGGPTRSTLARKFGSLARFYELVGYKPDARQRMYLGRSAWTNSPKRRA